MSVNTSFGFSLGLPGAISISGSSETQIVVPAFAYNSGSPVPSPAFAAGAPLQVQVPQDIVTGSSFCDGHAFAVKIVGTFTSGAAAATFVPNLYLGNSATLGSNTKLTAASGQTISASASTNFQMTTVLLWDSTSKALNGYYTLQVADNAPVTHALDTAGSSVTEAGLIFTFSVTFGSQTGAASFNLKQFTVDAA